MPAGSRPRAPGAHSVHAAFVAAACYNNFWFFVDFSVNLSDNADLFVAFCVLRWAAEGAVLRLSVTSPHPNFDYTKISMSAKYVACKSMVPLNILHTSGNDARSLGRKPRKTGLENSCVKGSGDGCRLWVAWTRASRPPDSGRCGVGARWLPAARPGYAQRRCGVRRRCML